MQDTVTGWDMVFGLLAAVLCPFLIGLSVVYIAKFWDGFPILIRDLGAFLVLSPFLSWVGALLAVPVASTALRRGYAGWGMAVFGGALVPSFFIGLAFVAFNGAAGLAMFLVTAPVGALAGAAFWLAVRLRRPVAFVALPAA